MKTRNQQGFTLAELMIVLIIIGVLGTASLSGWQRWQQHQRMMETAQQLLRFLHGLRAWANWHNSEQRLWLQPGEHWCLGSGTQTIAPCLPGRRMQLLAPHPQVKITELAGNPGFYGKRNMAKAGHITFGDDRERWRVVISARGRIRLCKEELNRCQS